MLNNNLRTMTLIGMAIVANLLAACGGGSPGQDMEAMTQVEAPQDRGNQPLVEPQSETLQRTSNGMSSSTETVFTHPVLALPIEIDGPGNSNTPSAAPALVVAAQTSAPAGTPPVGTGNVSAPPQVAPSDTGIGSTAHLLLNPSRGLVLGQPTPSEDWGRAASLVATQPGWTSFVASRRALVDAWRAQPRERADLVAGYMHDYVDPATGVPLSWAINTPEPPAGGTAAQVRMHQAWVFYVRSYNIRMLGEAVRIFRSTNDATYRDWAAAQLDFYAQNYNLWPLRTVNGRGRMYRTGLDEATASFTLVDAARLLAPYVSSARADAWKRDLLMPMATNLKTTGSPLTNIGLWQAAAVTRIGLRYGDAALVDWGLNSATGTRATLAQSLSADNLWDEGSFSYNMFVIDALFGLTLAAAIEGRADLVAPERLAMGRLVMAPLEYRFENGFLPTPGDSTAGQVAIDARHHQSFYRVLPTWWGVQRTGTGASWDLLLDPPPALPAPPALPEVQTRQFPSVRMAVLRAGSWQTFVHFGQAVANHAQEEALTYELHESAQAISTDSGTVSYSSPFHSEYFSRGASHNVPLVDGLGQQTWAPGVVDSWDANDSFIQVTQPNYRSGVAATRRLEQRTNGLVETTKLRATDLQAHRLGVAFHTACTIAPATGLAPAAGALPPASTSTSYWSGLSTWSAAGTWSVNLNCGDRLYRYEVTGPATQTVFTGSAPTTPLPAARAVMYYETTGAQAEFRASIIRVR